MIYLRNVQTGEIKQVEPDSFEFRELIREVYDHSGSARPAWEQTSDSAVRRMDDGTYRVDHDFGYDDKPIGDVRLNPEAVEQLRPNPHPERELSPGERESGIDSWEQKVESLDSSRGETGEGRLERGLERAGNIVEEPTDTVEMAPRTNIADDGGDAEGSSPKSSKRRSSSKAGSGSSSSGSSSSASAGSEEGAKP